MVRRMVQCALACALGCGPDSTAADGTDGNTTSSTAQPTGDASASTGDPTSTTSATTTDSGVDSSGAASTTDEGPKYDVGMIADLPVGECFECSLDARQVQTCDGTVLETCTGDEACDPATWTCANACEAAVHDGRSPGCDYFPVYLPIYDEQDACFAAIVANTWDTPAHLTIERSGDILPIEEFTRIPTGAGSELTYEPFDAVAGLAPGEVAVLFLSGLEGDVGYVSSPCPIASAIPEGVMTMETGIWDAFHLVSDVPVTAHQTVSFRAADFGSTGTSLLLPSSAWGTNYVTLLAWGNENTYSTGTTDIVAAHDDTIVSIAHSQLPQNPSYQQFEITLDAGEHAIFAYGLYASVIESNHPIGLFAAHPLLGLVGEDAGDHVEQMIPPVRALGHHHVGIMHRTRWGEPALWRISGAVDGTTLEWSSDVGGPATLELGETIEFETDVPFEVTSQDSEHPFALAQLMLSPSANFFAPNAGIGDTEYVLSVPPEQFMSRYVFFAGPTFPDTSIVVVRAPVEGEFEDVELDCDEALGGWESIGVYEWTRLDLTIGGSDVGACSTGRHEIHSDGPFGVTVWGWGAAMSEPPTSEVSFGFQAGMHTRTLNDVLIAVDEL
jgi:hypothetical protein